MLRSASRRPRRPVMLASLLGGILLLPGPARSEQKARERPEPARSPEKPAPILGGVGVWVGGGVRLDDSPSFETTQRTGIVVGGHVFVSPSYWFSVGLAYDHSEMSREETSFVPAGNASVVRRLDTLWADLRVYVLRRGGVAPFVNLAPGLVWQSARAGGFGYLGPTTNEPITFRCEANAGANFALRAGLGIEVPAATGLVLSGQMTLDNLRMSSDILDDCVPGAGSAAVMGFRAGLAYRLDVSHLLR